VTVDDEYRVLARHERYRGPLFAVRTDEVAMPDGGVAARDYVLHVGAVAVVALDGEGRIVLVRQHRPALGREVWELPAGLEDVAGEAPADTAVRELAEEADLTAARWEHLVDVHTSPGYSNELVKIYLARDLEPVPAAARHRRTHEEAGLVVRRVDLEEAVRMVFAGEITNGPCVAGVLATHARQRGR
jgi:8-oxo-dGTP pyrophosphatase MutT (NUDIX family)